MMKNIQTPLIPPVQQQGTTGTAGNLRARSISLTFFALAAILTALPAFSGTFTPPEGCQLESTVQNRGCTVSQYYRCSADPKGDQRSVIFDQDGLAYLSHIDAETRWLESSNLNTGVEDYLVEKAEDHASFSTLLKTNRDDFDFWTESNRDERLHHVGHDELTGEKTVIDGVELEKTRFELVTTNSRGEVLITRSGQQFISRATGRFYGGIEQSRDWTGENRQSDDSPVLFSFPGENGFGETTPLFDCGQMLAQLYDYRSNL